MRRSGMGAGHGIGIHRAALFSALYNAASAAQIPIITRARRRLGENLPRMAAAFLTFADGERTGRSTSSSTRWAPRARLRRRPAGR